MISARASSHLCRRCLLILCGMRCPPPSLPITVLLSLPISLGLLLDIGQGDLGSALRLGLKNVEADVDLFDRDRYVRGGLLDEFPQELSLPPIIYPESDRAAVVRTAQR